jgi:16S rRNA (cytosine1402-N4)-methyltransferase
LRQKQTPKQKCAMHQNKNQNTTQTLHVPVLLEQVLTYLDPKSGESYLDLTAGYGGHASAILARTTAPKTAILVDRDANATRQLQSTAALQQCDIWHTDYLSACQRLVSEGKQFDIILADLGVSSPHLNEGSRGFSFQQDGPLDMRMDQTQELTAQTVVNEWPEAELVTMLTEYGEEPKARQIAKLITSNRPYDTTTQLARIVARAWPGHSRVHPATRTFQALRVAVNDELGQLRQALPLMHELLAPGGRLGIISFHSLEDRLVKQYMSEHAGERYDANLRLITKHPAVATPDELVFNPRARSAKLRVAVKIKNKTERSSHANSGKK